VKYKRYLIDTHCWLWWHIEPSRLGQNLYKLIEDEESEIFFSVISAWEIVIKFYLHKLTLPFPPEKYIPKRLQSSFMEVLPVHLEHVLQAGVLPSHHKDPFDRLLIAQAKAEGLTMMTRDKQFGRYEVAIVS
jgi:PIN domain nuclease of toxin-antitoxin system